MLRGTISFVERLFWMMIWVVGLFILAMIITGYVQDKADGNFLGRFAQWINDHARPQAS